MNKEEWYDYLNFSQSQKVLLLFILVVNIMIKSAPYFLPDSKIKFEYHALQSDTLVTHNRTSSYNGKPNTYPADKHKANNLKPKKGNFTKEVNNPSTSILSNPSHITYKPFVFDPNRLPEDSIRLLPIPNVAKRNWIKYRRKGGSFDSPEALLKIYGMDTSSFIPLQELIHIKKKTRKKIKKQNTVIYVNKATEEEWRKLHGIGPFYAKNIVKYRDQLGGFVRLDQLKEVYRMPDSTYVQILPHLRLDSFQPPFNINTIDLQALFKHPYISYKEAKVISQYRKQHGPFNNWSELSNILILNEEFIYKIKPYFNLRSIPEEAKEKGISGL